MATLYVTEQGARVEKEYGRFLVTREDEVLLAVPAGRVSHVVLVGNVGVTTPALIALLKEEIGLSLVSRWGELRGHLTPPTGKNIPLRHQQYARAQDPAFCLAVSQAYVGGKLRNYRALARRMARSRSEVDQAQIARISASIRQLKDVADLAALRGVEGEGSRAYFAVYRQALKPGLGFERRTRRPPKDAVNALLSLGYTLLTDNLFAACEIAGLDPYDGFFHSDKYGRPALALDLVEEFRGVIVDSVVLNMVNRGMVAADDFEPGPEGGVYLKPKGMRVFFQQYAARLNTEVIHPVVGRRLSYQKCFEVQARLLVRVIKAEADAYQPFLTK
jgi:CRISPR-associated protein Cas1